jgi:predicted oxidoreductase
MEKLMTCDADGIIVGGGLAGLVAAAELAEAGKKIIIVDQEPEQSLGGQAFWSLGGIFLVNSPEQRHLGIHDSYDLALEDWMGMAASVARCPPASSPPLPPARLGRVAKSSETPRMN